MRPLSAEPLEASRRAVATLLDRMAAETATRRDWWRKGRNPDGWPKTLTLRSAVTGEETVLNLGGGSRGK